MSKDLEREYRTLVDSEAPDLWSRIEAGLEEKSAPSRKRISKKGSSRMWAGLVAACACVALVTYAMTGTMRMGNSSGSASGDTAYDSAAPLAASPTGDTSSNSMGQEAAEAAYEDGADGEAAESGGIDSAVTSDEMHVSADAAANADGASDFAADCFEVTVEIVDADVRMDSGIVYTARVTGTDNSDIQMDSEIKIFSSAAADGVTVLERARTYDLTLRGDYADDAGQDVMYELVEVR